MASDKMKQKLDKILGFVQERLGEELGGLMGATLIMSNMETRLVSKEEYFDEPSGKVVFSDMVLSGEIEGQGGLLISVKDAVRLGGTLIMLPDNELAEAVASEDYSEEISDSYGELANLVAGAYTSTFEEMFPKNFRFIRKESVVISPMKVDVDSDEPVPNQLYYQVSSTMTLNGTELDQLTLLMPAEPFGLVPEAPQEVPASAEPETVGATPPPQSEEAEEAGTEQTESAPEEPASKPFDIKKQKKRVDACLAECRVRMEEEVGALLGSDIKLTDHATTIINKEDFFMDEAPGKAIFAHMDVVGELDGKSYIVVGLRDAIRIGGTLIMLPPDELENVVQDGEFGDDSEDAYGEIANIISGVYTKVFEEQYPDKTRFIKTHLEEVVSMKVDCESDDPIPDVIYYMASANMHMAGKEMGKLQILLPAGPFKLEGLVADAQAETADSSREKGTVTGAAGSSSEYSAPGVITPGSENDPEYLIVSNDPIECEKITAIFNQQGIVYRVLDYKENISNYLPGNVRAIFLVMSTVDEKGLGVAIKVSSACSLPLVAAGPQWTRTKVIKAVKYGVDDILLTPATDSDICEKIDSLQVQKAA